MKSLSSKLLIGITFVIAQAGFFCLGVCFANKRPFLETKRSIIRSAYDHDWAVQYFYMFNNWFYLNNHNKSIAGVLKDAGYRRIAIYGMGLVGRRLLEEFERTQGYGEDFCVVYGIDSDVRNIDYGIEVVEVSEELKKMKPVDAIIVTPLYAYKNVKYKLESILSDTWVLSLGDVVSGDF